MFTKMIKKIGFPKIASTLFWTHNIINSTDKNPKGLNVDKLGNLIFQAPKITCHCHKAIIFDAKPKPFFPDKP